LSDPHPKYPNPTIVEAICEIAFVSTSQERLSSRALYALVGDEFPEMQPIANMLQIVVQPGLVFPSVPAPQQPQNAATGFRFGTATNDRFVQVSQNNFVYQIVGGPYEGWDAFKAKLTDLWSTVSGVLKAEQIVKIGMRYVNRIALTDTHPHLSDWLQKSDDLPEALIASRAHFLARIESTPSVDSLKLVTLANQIADSASPRGAILLDIDCLSNEAHEASNELISKKLEILHDNICAVFSSAKTGVLEAKLKGG
jgi:uncharacterized protein (TIGR04255 family)